ncbi:hypothetical protein L2K70_11390 [Nocardioides KLBMP 9356]|uniref:Galactose oxidase n=1 Tax=Nocardioides potassii TaxID=2911371 RepID=A0ABS9HAJ5_9ACTN|nr:hypothetical protein [Nocardioides potassii]MCF6378206.1 hypothetical protein [Nocardioides potassii]
MRSRASLAPVVAALLLAGLVGCDDKPDDRTPQPESIDVTWTERLLPEPAGPPGRTVVRDAVECGDGWWVVGAVFLDNPTETRDTRPAAWFSSDRETWTSVPVDARTYWGRRAIINSVACSRGRVAMLGARSGGAHGNPRVTSFYADGDRIADVRAVFIQFGGVTATNVNAVSGGPAGWLITGNRISGPGVWVTDDPREFTRVEGEPGLTDDGDLQSITQGGGWAGDGWIVVGGGARTGEGLDPDPLAWTSSDGLTWMPEEMPATDDIEDAQRVLQLDDGRLLVVGRIARQYAAWVRDGDQWSDAVRFGDIADSWRGAPYVASLARTQVGVLATISTGDHYELWHTDDGRGWDRVVVPLEPETAGDHTLVAGDGTDGLLLVGDSGDGGRVWTGTETGAETGAEAG